MAQKNVPYVWMNGEIIPWDDAKVHVRSESFMKGSNVFEGIRAYTSPDDQQLYIFRVREHMDRLFNSSMKILRLQIKWTGDDLIKAIVSLLHACDTRHDCHIRPIAYYGVGGEDRYDTDPNKIEMGCVITHVLRTNKPSLWDGVNVCVSSWRRIDDDSIPPRVKAGANYLNGRYVRVEARLNGYDNAIILNRQGKVSEGPGGCFMMVRGGKVVTPPVTAGILESITRDTIMELARKELGLEVVEREIDRTELYIAEEAFYCGTGHQVQPIVSVDRYPVGSGKTGPVVKQIQEVYFNTVRGQNPRYAEWLTPVY